MAEPKLFDKWSFKEVNVTDPGLQQYINLQPVIVPRSNGAHHNTPFYKTKVNIVERFINRLQVTGHKGKKHIITTGRNTGKARKIALVVKDVLQEIENRTKENPIQVFVSAIENASPREEVITIERSGAKYAQAVDIAPQRRIDLTLRYMCQGAAHKAFDSEISLKDALVDEIINGFNGAEGSAAISKKEEIEKMAAAAK